MPGARGTVGGHDPRMRPKGSSSSSPHGASVLPLSTAGLPWGTWVGQVSPALGAVGEAASGPKQAVEGAALTCPTGRLRERRGAAENRWPGRGTPRPPPSIRQRRPRGTVNFDLCDTR